MDIHLPEGGWSELLLKANNFPHKFSLSYALDLRYLFLRYWIDSLEREGIRVLRQPLPGYRYKNARVIKQQSIFKLLAKNNIKELDADFCLNYGFDDYSYKALNYLQRIDAIPRHFISPSSILSLGNIAIGIDAIPSGINVFPPPELSVCGIVEIPCGKKRSLLGWLGVRYVRHNVPIDLIKQIDSYSNVFVQSKPMSVKFHNEQYPKRRYVQYYPNGPYSEITEEDEALLRKKLGYPAKGKTGIREKMLYDSACQIFGEDKVIRRYRGRELDGLEIDVWIPSHKIALEYQGQQHSKHIPHWHGEYGLLAQKQRDTKKRTLCKKFGYQLMMFDHEDNLDFVSLLEKFRYQWWI